jgi:hypothetical protein
MSFAVILLFFSSDAIILSRHFIKLYCSIDRMDRLLIVGWVWAERSFQISGWFHLELLCFALFFL